MRYSTRLLVAQMWSSVANRDFQRVQALQAQLEQISRKSPDELELAEVLVDCGLALFIMGRWEDALRKLDGALYRYGLRPNPYAVVQWMRGYILWFMPGREEEAILAWQSSLDKFQFLANRRLLPQAEMDWYHAQITEMEDSLQFAIQAVNEDRLPSGGTTLIDAGRIIDARSLFLLADQGEILDGDGSL